MDHYNQEIIPRTILTNSLSGEWFTLLHLVSEVKQNSTFNEISHTGKNPTIRYQIL